MEGLDPRRATSLIPPNQEQAWGQRLQVNLAGWARGRGGEMRPFSPPESELLGPRPQIAAPAPPKPHPHSGG